MVRLPDKLVFRPWLSTAGDFAYDMEDNGGVNGDTFMNRIQKIAATTPYMTSVGSVPAMPFRCQISFHPATTRRTEAHSATTCTARMHAPVMFTDHAHQQPLLHARPRQCQHDVVLVEPRPGALHLIQHRGVKIRLWSVVPMLTDRRCTMGICPTSRRCSTGSLPTSPRPTSPRTALHSPGVLGHGRCVYHHFQDHCLWTPSHVLVSVFIEDFTALIAWRSSNADGDCPQNVTVRTVLEPVFHQYGVDIVLEVQMH